MTNLPNQTLANTNTELDIKFFGNIWQYEGLFKNREGHKRRYQYFSERFASKGIKNVYLGCNFNSSELIFQELTLCINPVILDATINIEAKNFTKDNFNIRQYISIKELSDANKVTIKYKDYIIGYFYPSRNLYICYMNIFHKLGKHHFDCCFNLMFGNLANSAVIELTPEQRLKKQLSNFLMIVNKNEMDLKRKIINYEHDITDYNKIIIDRFRESEICRINLKSIEMMKNSFEEVFVKKIEELKDIPFIKKYELKDGYIEVDFGDVEIEHKKQKYYIGDMIAKIYPNYIKFENLNNKTRNGQIHPHVNAGGDACFGSFSEDFQKIMASFEFKKIVILLRQFLFTYNERSPINNITYWKNKPFVEIEKEKEAEKKIEEANKIVSSLTEMQKKEFLNKLKQKGRTVAISTPASVTRGVAATAYF